KPCEARADFRNFFRGATLTGRFLPGGRTRQRKKAAGEFSPLRKPHRPGLPWALGLRTQAEANPFYGAGRLPPSGTLEVCAMLFTRRLRSSILPSRQTQAKPARRSQSKRRKNWQPLLEQL